MSAPLPFKPGDWAVDPCGERVARVIRIYELDGEALLDLSIYNHKGDRVGRSSPACGGPKSFEPACSAKFWERIRRPSFPVELKWVPNGDGTSTMRFWAGERLPPANWVPPGKVKITAPPPVMDVPPHFTHAELQHLVDLFAAANDPVSASIGAKAAEIMVWRNKRYPLASQTQGTPT